MKSAELVADALYAFRKSPANADAPLERVRLLGDPPAGGRVGVAFETGERAGTEGEVTLGQLVAPWEEAEAIIDEETGLEEIARAEPPQLADQAFAVELMLWVGGGTDQIGSVRGGVVLSQEAFANLVEPPDFDEAKLQAPPFFRTRSGLPVLPLKTAHAVAKALAREQPVTTLEWIEEWEASGQSHMPHYEKAFAQIRRWTGVTQGDLERARDNSDEQARLRRSLLEVREKLQGIEGQVERLRARIDEALEADDRA